jgi:predicted deacetylase
MNGNSSKLLKVIPEFHQENQVEKDNFGLTWLTVLAIP